MSNNIYYVYSYLREDGTPYYIGKGKGNRAYSKHRNGLLPEDKSRIIILHENLSEQDAFEKERQLISFYGRKDLDTGILRNLTDGGEGASGLSQETKQKISDANKGIPRSEEIKIKISIGNKGRILSEEHKLKLRKPKTQEHKLKLRKPKTQEHKLKLSDAMKNKTKTQEHKLKLSDAMKDRILSEEHKLKLRKSRSEEFKQKLRKPRSEEFKQKISNAMKGRILSEETKQKISDALKK